MHIIFIFSCCSELQHFVPLSFYHVIHYIGKTFIVVFFCCASPYVLSILFDLVYCGVLLLCIFVMILSSHCVILFLQVHNGVLFMICWYALPSSPLTIQSFNSSCSSITQVKHLPIMLFYRASPWSYINWFWFGLLQYLFVAHCCGGLMSFLPLMLLCFANALWCSPHDLLLCITFVFCSCLEF